MARKGKWYESVWRRSIWLLLTKMNHDLLYDKCKAEGDGEGAEYHKKLVYLYGDELQFLTMLIRTHAPKIDDEFYKDLEQNKLDFMRTHIDYVQNEDIKICWLRMLQEAGLRQFIGLPLTYSVGGMRGNYHGQ